jgi:hypothetical protein
MKIILLLLMGLFFGSYSSAHSQVRWEVTKNYWGADRYEVCVVAVIGNNCNLHANGVEGHFKYSAFLLISNPVLKYEDQPKNWEHSNIIIEEPDSSFYDYERVVVFKQIVKRKKNKILQLSGVIGYRSCEENEVTKKEAFSISI